MQKQQVKGLIYLPQFITKQEEKDLTACLIDREWNTSLKRRTQHYGFTYSYDQKDTLEQAKPIQGLPQVVKKQIQSYVKQHLDEQYEFDQIIVNEYLPGQGISPHIDNPRLFDRIIVSLSLNSDVIMVFESQSGQKIDKLLQRRSLIILSEESRLKWKHSIPSRKSDHGMPRKTRYSLTFRKVISQSGKLKQK